MNDVLIRKRTKKDGSVSWEYRFEIAMEDGKRKWTSKSGFKTKSEAQKAGKEAQRLYENVGQVTQPTEMSFADFLDYWIEHSCKLECKEVTVTGYQKKIRLYIKPALGSYRLKAITKDNLQDFITKMYNDGFSKNTLSSIKGILSKCFDYAVDRHYVAYNPASRLKTPKSLQPKTKTRVEPHVYVNADKMQQILERFPKGTVNHIPLLLGYRCGLRLGETFGLIWEDIDFEKKTLSINRQVQWYSNKKTGRGGNRKNDIDYGYWYFSEPKYKSYRTIDLDEDLLLLLSEEKRKQDKAAAYYEEKYTNYFVDEPLSYGGVEPPIAPSPMNKITQNYTEYKINLLCRREDGTYITARTMQHTSSVIHKQLDFPEFDYHSLRHTHATMLTEAGAPPVYTQKRLGHKNIDVTMNIYANHLTEQFKEQGTNVLNNLF